MTKVNIKEQILIYLKTNPTKNFSKGKLEAELKIRPFEKRIYGNSLKELKKEGLVFELSKQKRLMINNKINFIIGKFYFNVKGFGFVVTIDEEIHDLFISQNNINQALHEDIVVAIVTKKAEINKRAEGEIVSILERKIETIIGTYISNDKNFGFVIPDNNKINKDIFISSDKSNKANSYDKVVCQITKYPEGNRKPEGEIIEIIGIKWDKGVDILSIIKEQNIKQDFSTKVMRYVEKLPETISALDKENRLDLTGLKIFTIDGEDAKDLDDAVSIEKLPNGNYNLGVHIADVAHYVKYGTKLDEEALDRGTSVYLIDTVIPMLPKKISNKLCSLNPKTDKLTLSVFMEINNNGVVVNHNIYESFINTVARLHYTEVSDFLESVNDNFVKKYLFITEDLKHMKNLSLILMNKRNERGAINFDFPEAKIILDADGKVVDILKYERRIANKLIEEFMLVCNETIAEEFYWNQIPFVYRVHENPREEKIRDFTNFVKKYGYEISDEPENIDSKQLQNLLNIVKGKKEEITFNLLLLQSMQQARYNTSCKGHFGLATKFYCHFTSPIRRYPDLQIHRIIKEKLNGLLNSEKILEYEKIVEYSSRQASRKERFAEKAEDDLKELRKLEFMSDKSNQVFEGIVTSMNTNGLYITLDNTIEGFLKMDKIKDDKYLYVKEDFAFIGQKYENRIMIGDSILVSVLSVDLELRELLFNFISK